MRAKRNYPAALWLAVLAAFTALSWAQEPADVQVPQTPDAPVPAPEAPRATGVEGQMEQRQLQRAKEAQERLSQAREVQSRARDQLHSQVRIYRDEDGSLRIKTRDEDGETSEVQLDLGEEFGGALTRRIYDELESKGVLDEKGFVVDRVLDGVPENVSIGITRESNTGARSDRSHRRGGSGRHDHGFEFGDNNMELIPAILGILAVFGTPVLIVWLVTRNSYRKRQLLMDNINRMVVEGRDIPQEMLDSLEGTSPANLRDRGFTLIAVGLALLIWLSIAAGPEVGSLGLIPLFIGAARFINWRFEQQNSSGAG
ncbi:DUF6249 domain-containing protein [Microbulbifer sp. TYP-18]|uniref:DUF6249 domain-containing protein n=1 Tax=Microbulbifer sp. TYP-18 TaxID=3230024 RepID=UPI0034C63724